jgi:Domain of unknown function (DUF4149)
VFRWLFQFVLVLCLSIWVGSIVFFSVVVAPGIFRNLERGQAGELLSHLFPDYYLVGALCGGVALAVLVLLFLFDSGSRVMRLFQLALVALMLVASLYAGGILEGQIHRLRAERVTAPGRMAREEAGKRFERLHRRSVSLNLAVLGLGGVALGTTAVRRRVPS